MTGGPEVDVERCWEIIYRAHEEHGNEPSEDAVERFVRKLGAGEGP